MLQDLKTEASPLSRQQIDALQPGLDLLDPMQTAWLSGYLAGRLADGAAEADATPVSANREALQVVYASQTGNGEAVAERLVASATDSGLRVKLRNVLDLRPSVLKKLSHAVFVISTHGEGDPPDDALDLFDYLQSGRAPTLDGLRFNVLALGDRSYEQFCAAGRQLETLLEGCGAKSFAPRVECDVDYAEEEARWSADIIGFAREKLSDAENTAQRAASPARLSVVPATAAWERNHPFAATVERVQKITGLESTRDVYHLELSLEGSGLRYEPGDALGVWAPNRPDLVGAVLERLAIDPKTPVEADGCERSVEEWLTNHRELTRLDTGTLDGLAARNEDATLNAALDGLDRGEVREFLEARQLIDLLETHPIRASADDLVRLLRPLTPRSYSIASSQAAVDEEVHLTVATRRSDALGLERFGLASEYLNHRIRAGEEVKVFVEPNKRFRLPGGNDAPLILIAAGTGIAPYRAFLQQLEEDGRSPDTWLIFGNPNLRTDFLYQREWLRWRQSGLLNRIDCAFSRDQAEKHYVQHVVRDRAEALCDWLDGGAYLYLCGGLAMGQAVETAILEAVAEARGLDRDSSADYLAGLRRERRLLKDLY